MLLGVDPGLEGGWALLRPVSETRAELKAAGPVLRAGRRLDLPGQARTWRNALAGLDWSPMSVVAAIEAVDAGPQGGRSSTFAFGWAAGGLEGVLAGLGLREVLRPPPSVWKARTGLPGGRKGKVESIRLAERLLGVRLPEHQAEAALIVWYAWGARGVAVDGTGVLT